jgi:uncharacterized membrane protein
MRDKRGVTRVLGAIGFPVLIGLAALGAGTGLGYVINRHDQSAADAAALSAAYDV